MRKRRGKVIGAALLCAFSIAACGKEAGAGTPDDVTGTKMSGGNPSTVTTAPANGNDAGAAVGGETDGKDTMAGTSSQGQEEGQQAPEISFEILSESEKDEEGGELVRAQYPAFSISGEGYEALAAAFASLNEEWKGRADTFLADMKEIAEQYRKSVDSTYLFYQDINVNIMRHDREIVSVLVTRSVEEGGAHPNNYSHARNFNARTGEVLKLSDVVTVDDALKDKIKAELYASYSELEFDEALLEADIPGALVDVDLEWYFMDGQVCINFKEGSFGFGHAEGSLGVLIPVEK